MEAELAKMQRYFLHHRIVTYAIVLFLVLITFILISISRQIENEQAMLLDSQARMTMLNSARRPQANRTCPAGIPARWTFSGDQSSCYFGQARSIAVRCSSTSDRPIIINANQLTDRRGNKLTGICQDTAAFIYEAMIQCGCQIGGQVNITSVPRQITPTVYPTFLPISGVPGRSVPFTTPVPTYSSPKVTLTSPPY